MIGTLFFAPLLGMAVGAASGAIGAKLSDYWIEDRFMEELGAQLQPGTSDLFILVRKVPPDKVLDEVSKYGGTALRSSLVKDAEERLQQALQPGVGVARGERAPDTVLRADPAPMPGALTDGCEVRW